MFIVSSRDGRVWDRRGHRRVFLPLGFIKNDYDGHPVDSEMSMAIVPPVAVHDQLLMYYTGYSNKHNANTYEDALKDTYLGQIGLVRLPMDAFCSIDATFEGYVVTRPVRVTGSSQHVTAAARSFANHDAAFNLVWSQFFANLKHGVGEMRVEVEDPQGKVILGFSADECNPLRGYSLTRLMTWKDGKDLGALHGQSVRFKFVIRNAKPFSYSLE